jgi:hypothetical protein
MSTAAPRTDDLAEMLRWLGDRGWKPLLYAETRVGSQMNGGSGDDREVSAWVCYPQGAVRAWGSFRAQDPVAAVRGLYVWALEHPNEQPTFPAAAPGAGSVELAANVSLGNAVVGVIHVETQMIGVAGSWCAGCRRHWPCNAARAASAAQATAQPAGASWRPWWQPVVSRDAT